MLAIVLPLLLAGTGCPGSHQNDLPPDGATPSDAGTTRDAATVGDGATPSDGGVPDDGGEPPDDAAVTPDAGEPPVDAGVPGPSRIRCGSTECDADTHGCLASCLYADGTFMPACVATDADGRWPEEDCPTGMEQFPRLWLTCDGAEDCATGELCHMIHGSLGQYTYCFPCEGCDRRFLHVLCRSDADCSPDAPRCLPQADLRGYSTCEPM
jgi:hypothetical protein